VIEVRILGSLEASRDSRPVELGGAKQRALLAALVQRRGEVVSTDELIDALWGESPPVTAAKALHVHVSHLRKALGEAVVETHGSGYRLASGVRVDLDRFEELVASAREQQPAVAARTLREGLALWRGRPLADVAYEPFAQTEIARLEGLRLAALAARIDADLALGRHAQLVPELEALVAQHPLDDALRRQLMLALYRSGRQAEALDRYRDGRQRLVDELGLEPGPALRELEAAILRQDAALDLAPRPGPTLSGRRPALLVAAGGGLLLAAAIAAVIVALTRDGSPAIAPVARDSVAAIDPRTGRVIAEIPVGTTPTSIAIGEGAVWVLNTDDHTVSRIDAETKRFVKTFAVGAASTPTALVAGGGSLWVASGGPGTSSVLAPRREPIELVQLEPHTGVVASTIELPVTRRLSVAASEGPGERQLVAGRAGVWATDPSDDLLWRVDPRAGRVVATVRGISAASLALDDSSLWAATWDNAVVRINVRTNRVTRRIPLPAASLRGVAAGAGAVWALDGTTGSLWRVDLHPKAVARTIPVGLGATDIGFGHGFVWVVNTLRGTLLKVDPATNRVAARIPVGATPRGVAVGGDSVWVSVSGATALRATACAPVVYPGPNEPDFLIASDFPLRFANRLTTIPMTRAIEAVLERHGFRAGRYRIGYQSCDDSIIQTAGWDAYKCAANVSSFAADRRVIGMVGPQNSGCAKVELPIASRASLPVVSPSATWPSLTHSWPGKERGEPEVYHPAGTRTFARVIPSDDYQAAADALLAQKLGARRVFVLDDGSTLGLGLATIFGHAVERLGLDVAGQGRWSFDAANFRRLAARVRRAQPDAVFLGGVLCPRCPMLVRELRHVLGPRPAIIVPDSFFFVPDLLRNAGDAAIGVYGSVAGAPNASLPPAGSRFLRRLRAAHPGQPLPSFTAAYAAQATEVLLGAIARSDGTRASVARELLRTRVENGILGSFEFDRDGDTSLHPITIMRITGRADEKDFLLTNFEGAAVERVITPSPGLVRP
jgi:YVTN family beta-propeller protein